ncbi:MAG: hypothetical protein K1W38_20825 [Lachnospiraceae bacterium]|jgi:hypothetical protein
MAEMREKLMHFFNIGTAETPEYALLGDGITSLTEEFNPESNTKQYIHQANGTTSIKSYTPSISVEKEYIKNEKLQKWMDEKIKLLPVGTAAESDYVRLNVMETPTAEGTYPAVKRRCSYQFDNIGGDAGSELKNSMTLGGIGDGIQGTFNVKTGTFTEAAAPTLEK